MHLQSTYSQLAGAQRIAHTQSAGPLLRGGGCRCIHTPGARHATAACHDRNQGKGNAGRRPDHPSDVHAAAQGGLAHEPHGPCMAHMGRCAMHTGHSARVRVLRAGRAPCRHWMRQQQSLSNPSPVNACILLGWLQLHRAPCEAASRCPTASSLSGVMRLQAVRHPCVTSRTSSARVHMDRHVHPIPDLTSVRHMGCSALQVV